MTGILDCTIRDGGHLTDWNFTDELVRDTFEAAKVCGVKYFEIGYRNHGEGKFSKCLNDDLRSIILDKGDVKLVVMVNAREFQEDLFFEGDYADVVRVACHPNEISQGIEYCKILDDKNYESILHLMDVAHISDEQFRDLKQYSADKILYFADSYGALLPKDIQDCFKLFNDKGFHNLGFHGHNNKQLAFINTLTAMDCGAASVDVTVYGMGRAAGNTPAELLLNEIGMPCKPYFDLIEKYYIDLHKQNPWGYSLKNLSGGISNSKVV